MVGIKPGPASTLSITPLPLVCFQTVNEADLDRLLGVVVDVENLFMCVHKEEDPDTKQVYFYLFKLLRKSLIQASKPAVEGPLVSSGDEADSA